MLVTDLILERRPQLAIADNNESRVGHLAHGDRGGVDEMVLTLVRHERGNVPDDWRLHRQVEGGTDVGGVQPDDPLHVDTFVHDGDLRSGDTIGHETVADDPAVGDEPVDLRVGPARERRVADARLDAA